MKVDKAKIIIVMGVSGSGKTTLGKALAENLNYLFLEGDAFHSNQNIKKMSLGKPLTDSDRIPWLQALNRALYSSNSGVVLACSALKASYRKLLSEGLTPAPQFIFIDCERDLLEKRMEARRHFMPASLLNSQLEALEKPEEAIMVSGEASAEKQIDYIISYIS